MKNQFDGPTRQWGRGCRAVDKEHATKHSIRLTIGLFCSICLLSCVQATDSGEVSGLGSETISFDSASDLEEMDISTGAWVGAETAHCSSYGIDTEDAYAGGGSLKLSADLSTNRWYCISRTVNLNDVSQVEITYSVKGMDLDGSDAVYDNCYVGFVYYDADGAKKFKVKHYGGSFDWLQDTNSISNDNVTRLDVSVFQSIPGQFWVDELTIDSR